MSAFNQQVSYPDANLLNVKWTANGTLAVTIGDLVYLSSGVAYPMSNGSGTGVIATDQATYAPLFVGVAHERKLATEGSGYLQVSLQTVRELATVDSAARHVGALVSIDESAGNALYNAQVAFTTNAALAIGRLIKEKAAGDTTVLVLLQSNIVPAVTPNANTAVNTAANLSLTGNQSVGGTLTVTGASNCQNTLAVGGTLAVTGITTLAAALNAQTTLRVGTTSTLVGAVNAQNTLAVGGLLSTVASTLAATGTNQAGAAAIVSQTTVISAGVTAGVKLPAIVAGYATTIFLHNGGGNAQNVYPATGAQINALGANNAASVGGNNSVVFSSDGNATWYSTPTVVV